MANTNITKSEEADKFLKAVFEYFHYNRTYGNTLEKDYRLLLILYLVKNNAIKIIDSTKLTNEGKSKLKVLFSYPLQYLNVNDIPQELDLLYSCDCCVINIDGNEKQILGIAGGLGINLDYNFHKEHNINLYAPIFKLLSISPLWYKENFWWALNHICYGNQDVRNYFVNRQPYAVINLLIKLLDAKNGNIYFPYANLEILEHIISENMSDEIMPLIHTEDHHTYYLIRLVLLICGISKHYHITNSNIIDDWCGDIMGFDYMLAIPPMGVKSNTSDYFNVETDYFARSSRDVLHKSIGVYTSGICYNGYAESVIKEFLDNDWLESVILLPRKIFYNTDVDTVIIIVNKNKKHNGFVKIIDASDCYIKENNRNLLDVNAVYERLDNNDNLFSISDIVSLDYNISPQLYSSRNDVDIPENYHVFKVDDVLDVYRGGNNFSETEGRVVNISDLSDDSLSSKINIDNLKIDNDLRYYRKVTEPIFLFSRIRDLRPSYCEATPNNPIFLHSNIFAYKLKKTANWIDYQYFCYELSRRAKGIQMGAIPSVPRPILNRLNIYFPSKNIEDQKNIVNEAIYQKKISETKELGLQEVIERMKAEYINEVRMRKHDMRPYLTNLGSIGRMMQAYISKLEGMPEIQNKLSSLVVEHKKALESLSNLVSVLSEEQTFGNAEEIDINKFFIDLGNSNDSKVSGFKLNYHVDKNAVYESAILKEESANDDIPLYVNIAKIDFERLVTNILENARTHGFAGREDNNGVVSIFLTVNSETDSFQIDFVNNGNPLPEGMNKMRFGLRGEKAGQTGGTGNGGYIIKSIVEHYKGDYDVFMDGEDTVIRVLLPISRENYD